jgi:hypothetical protein
MSKTLTPAEVRALERKARVGWAHYYEEVQRMQAQAVTMNARLAALRTKMLSEPTIPTHLKDEYVEMCVALGKPFECSICMETPPASNVDISSCGHRYCKPCFVKLKENSRYCGVCRRSLFS